MSLFYNEFVSLSSFLPDHKSFLEESILQGLFWPWRCWLWIDHNDSDLAPRHLASAICNFWIFAFSIISVVNILLHNIPMKHHHHFLQRKKICHAIYYFYLELYEICCFIQGNSYLFLNRLHKPFYIFEGWLRGPLNFGFWNAERRKSLKNNLHGDQIMLMCHKHNTFALRSTRW